jgi:hypothetical protein
VQCFAEKKRSRVKNSQGNCAFIDACTLPPFAARWISAHTVGAQARAMLSQRGRFSVLLTTVPFPKIIGRTQTAILAFAIFANSATLRIGTRC